MPLFVLRFIPWVIGEDEVEGICRLVTAEEYLEVVWDIEVVD